MNEQAKKRAEDIRRFRAYQVTVAAWLTKRLSFWKREKIGDTKEYKDALAEYQKFKQSDDIDYDAVVTYARDLYASYEKTDRSHDDKADAIIRYLGGGSAIVTFGTLISIKSDAIESRILGLVAVGFLVPALILAFLAVWSAIIVRRPQDNYFLPPVDWARRMNEYHKTRKNTELNIYLLYSPICHAFHHRVVIKGRWLDRAHKLYVASIASLCLPVVAIILALCFMPFLVRVSDQIGLYDKPSATSAASAGNKPASETDEKKPSAVKVKS